MNKYSIIKLIMNVHFDNFGYDELVSKNAKDRLKKYLKTTLNTDKDLKVQLEEKSEELLDKYFKKHNGKDLFLNYKVEDNDIHLNLEIKDKELIQREINKQKLRNKLAQEKSKRYLARDRNKFFENEKQEKKLLNSDPRVTPEMVQKYKIAKEKFGQQLPNPIVILNDKSVHVKKYVEYVGMIIQNSQSEDQMMTMLDNEYSHYINSVTGFDYRAVINSFKQNLNKLQKEDEIKKGPVFEKLDEIAEDSEEDVSKDINSDDETSVAPSKNESIDEASNEVEESITNE